MLDKVKVIGIIGGIFTILRLSLDVEIPIELQASVEAVAMAVFTLVTVITAYITPERKANVDKLKTR